MATTARPGVLGGIGGFGGLFALDTDRYRQPVLVSATDGVGTKLLVARAAGRYGTVGIDLVAMCVDDLVCSGAEPLFFLDYVAVGRLVPDRIDEVVAGVADGCRQAGCALDRRRDGRAPRGRWPTTTSTWPASPSAWSSADDELGPTGSGRATCSSGCRRRDCGRTATRWPATCC